MSFLSKLFGRNKVKHDNDYVKNCLALAFSESDDQRKWNEYKELMKTPGLCNDSFKYDEALSFTDSVKDKYKDFDYLYSWIAHAHRRQKHYDKARQILIAEAIRWWMQSVLLQESIESYGNHGPFLYLSYVAQPFELSALSNRLIAQADRIETSKPRLVETEGDKLFSMILTAQEGSLIGKAMESLAQKNLKFRK